ncbi:hypothetical protein LZ32DRAFT_599857 [Colletotrichum eremochloae]|nr:hypothetical protein LZ32DRAFT_599857 [Colletotrichum eremochloae]
MFGHFSSPIVSLLRPFGLGPNTVRADGARHIAPSWRGGCALIKTLSAPSPRLIRPKEGLSKLGSPRPSACPFALTLSVTSAIILKVKKRPAGVGREED